MAFIGVVNRATVLARRCVSTVCVLLFASVAFDAWADDTELSLDPSLPEASAAADSSTPYKSMSLDELMNIEVMSVSRRMERLSESPSAIQVVTGDDIRASGATSLPEALRLLPNLRVAQVNSYGWIVSARGFSGLFANKLLVLIDGRSVYTPLFGGVSWDAQNVVLEDVDRIEAISGPGGTLWGSNAVNGVINVVTKSAKDTQGLYMSAAGGTFVQNWDVMRYGGSVGENLYYRVYGQRFDRDNTIQPNGDDEAFDAWNMTNGGFRLDYYPTDKNTLTLQGDFYGGTERTEPDNSALDGQYVLGRLTHQFSSESDLALQIYIDRAHRADKPSTLTNLEEAYDIDFQHRFALGKQNNVLWGAGFRFTRTDVENNTPFVGFVPNERDLPLYSLFVQDEFTLIPKRVKITVGTKLEHNVFSGLEVQPSGRIAWTPDERQTIWGAVSRAVRAPSRIDVDYHLPTFPLPPNVSHVDGGPNFDSEKVVAYELGYRIQPLSELSVSLAGFYNRYDDIYSVEALPGTKTYQIQNGVEGDSWGAELSATYQPTEKLRLRGGYTYFHKDLWNKPGHSFDTASLGHDPQDQFVLQVIADLPKNFQFDVTGRYVGSAPDPDIPAYFTMDARLAWQYKNLEFSIVGQNLLDNLHPEFLSEIPRSVYGKVTVRL